MYSMYNLHNLLQVHVHKEHKKILKKQDEVGFQSKFVKK